jgi:hypothetical protein
MVDVHDLFQKILQSDSPMTMLEAVLRDHPDLPEASGKFWADGFATDQIPPSIARFLVDRGAMLSVNAAAGFGFTDSLADILRGDALQVNAKGGDGCTPLHFARDVVTAQLLLDHGADIDARDDDHASTPAQWRIGKAPKCLGSCSSGEQLPTSSLPLPSVTSISLQGWYLRIPPASPIASAGCPTYRSICIVKRTAFLFKHVGDTVAGLVFFCAPNVFRMVNGRSLNRTSPSPFLPIQRWPSLSE